MAGIRTGVSAQLKLLQPSLISVHCVAHRLALAVVQAAKVVSPVKKLKNQINALFVYFHGSPKRQGRLEAAFSVLEDKPSLKLQRPSDTRWLACDEAIQVVKKSLNPLSIVLQEISNEGDATALGLATLLTKYEFVAAVFFMAEIMPILSRLSKTFQIENIDFSSIKPSLDRAQHSIATLKTLSESKSADWQGELVDWEKECLVAVNGHDIEHFLSKFALPFIKAVETNLSERFPDHDISILSAGAVFDPNKVPVDPTVRYSHGRDSVTMLATHYHCDTSETIYEWKEVVSIAKEKYTNTRSFLKCLVSHRSVYPNLGTIASALLVIPMHSADAERGFSTLGRVRTKSRSRLNTKSLNSLLMISIEGPPLKEFDVKPCLEKWRSIRKRRVFSGKPQAPCCSTSTQT